jgi:beta-lactamase regulating signal transducer with metallopeptidase domain
MVTALYGSWLLFVALLVVKLFPRISPLFRCWLLRLAYAKLLIALLWPYAISLPVLPASPSAIQTSIDRIEPRASTNIAAQTPIDNGIHVLVYLMCGWLGGSVLVGGRFFIGWNRVRRLIAESQKYENDDARRLKAILASLGPDSKLARNVSIRHSGTSNVPIATGIRSPIILLPNHLLATMDDQQLRLILAHELGHIRRRDLAWNLLYVATHTLFFFHPFVWHSRSAWRLSQEVACDQFALMVSGGDVTEYGQLILRLIRSARHSNMHSPAAVSAADYPILKRRLIMLRDISPRTNHPGFVATCVMLAMLLVVLVPWRLAVAENDQVNPKAKPLPKAPPMDVVAKQLKEKYHMPLYTIKIQTKDPKSGKVEEGDTVLTVEGILGSLGIGKTQYSYEVQARKDKTAKIGFSWEEFVDFPKEVNGEFFFSSHTTEKSVDVRLGKETVVELTAPDDRKRHQTFVFTVQEYESKTKK